MRALTFHGPGDVRVETVADATVEAPGDAVVRVSACAVCGSDLHVYHGRETGLDAGTVMGHELVGEVVAVGGGVTGFGVGDRVLSPFTTSCGACWYCARGLTARCVRGQLFGWVAQGVGLHGAQAEYVRVPLADSTLVGIPEGASDALGLLLGDVLSTGWYCATRGDVGPGDVVAVVGAGPVGLMAVVAARELGAARVFAVDRVPERLALAASFGAEPIDFGAVDPSVVVREATDGRGADAVLEAVGSPGATRSAVALVRPGGTISVVGVHTEARFELSPVEAYDKNLTLRIGRCPARAMIDELAPIVGRLDVERVFSHRLPLADGAEAYAVFDGKADGCTKVLLTT